MSVGRTGQVCSKARIPGQWWSKNGSGHEKLGRDAAALLMQEPCAPRNWTDGALCDSAYGTLFFGTASLDDASNIDFAKWNAVSLVCRASRTLLSCKKSETFLFVILVGARACGVSACTDIS